ncbi:MAG TPA: hypothetical protein VKF80_06210 [Candidatus Eisenbacteria bacterium]|nr:hypothetical protein [Candidatus Eisenbacteria bacterium]
MIDRDDERLDQLLRAVRAEANPVLWTRARARIEAGEPSGLIAWLMRPAALAASLATLVLSVGLSALLLFHSQSRLTSSETSLADALIATPSTPIEELSVPTTDAMQPADTGATQ